MCTHIYIHVSTHLIQVEHALVQRNSRPQVRSSECCYCQIPYNVPVPVHNAHAARLHQVPRQVGVEGVLSPSQHVEQVERRVLCSHCRGEHVQVVGEHLLDVPLPSIAQVVHDERVRLCPVDCVVVHEVAAVRNLLVVYRAVHPGPVHKRSGGCCVYYCN
jgi:hypothetical protein